VGLVLNGYGAVLEASLRGRFDIVGFDPRGVAASEPLHCFRKPEDFYEYCNSFSYPV
jgi:hypothetical protein